MGRVGNNGAPLTADGIADAIVERLPSGMPPSPAAPPRVCWQALRQENSPVCAFSTPVPLCGKAERKGVDALTADRGLVSCEECKALLAAAAPGKEPLAPVDVALAGSAPPAVGRNSAGGFAQVMDALDVVKLEARLKELKGEQEALKVLLKAGKARDRARLGPVVESD
jgi:hypothetical protein